MIIAIFVWVGVMCHVGVWLLNRKLNAVIAERYQVLIERVDIASDRIDHLDNRLDILLELP